MHNITVIQRGKGFFLKTVLTECHRFFRNSKNRTTEKFESDFVRFTSTRTGKIPHLTANVNVSQFQAR
jgi:hypothetical protein